MAGIKLANVALDSKLVLAPMEGVNCAAFRLLCREHGAGLVSTPMTIADELAKDPERIIRKIGFLKQEKPVSVQLVAGTKSELIKDAVKIAEEYADIIDINLGCPKKDILTMKAGAFFSKHPEQIKKIAEPIINSTNKPVTAKIRIGWDDRSINTLESVKILEDLGVSAITIHARTRKQVYSGKSIWEEIKKAKETAGIPIIGNGDIFKPGNAKAMLEQTGCDLVMIARGCIGNPFIFSSTKKLLETGRNPAETTVRETKDEMMRFIAHYERYDKMRSISELKQHMTWFTKSMKNSQALRKKLAGADGKESLIALIEGHLEQGL